MSNITTHVLDTSLGRPAAGLAVVLYFSNDAGWTELARGLTNADGRVTSLLPKEDALPVGTYKLRFETKGYFDRQGIAGFYPFVEIAFQVHASEHYHVPLLLNPFGYSTYRGS